MNNKITSISIDELKFKHRSRSKYWQAWHEVKREGMINLALFDNSLVDTIKEAVQKQKQYDYYYKVACELELGHELLLVFEHVPDESLLRIKLKDTKDMNHPFNLL